MERWQQESERQLQALLHETRRLRQENDVLRIQASSSGLPRNRQPRSQQTNSKRNEKVIYPENAETPLDEHDTRLDARPLPTHHALLDEISYSTCMSSKRRRDREIPAVGLNACKARTLDARCGKTKCSRGPRGVSWSLNYTSHAEEESRWHAFHAFQPSHHQLWTSKGIHCAEIFHMRRIQWSIWSHHALQTTYDPWYWEWRAIMQGLPSQPSRSSSLMVPLPPNKLCSQLPRLVGGLYGAIFMLNMT